MKSKPDFPRRRRNEAGQIRFPEPPIALLLIQLAIVSSIAAKYLYQRWTCPRVWTRTAAYDPELLMRGRYLSLQLTVDGCQSTLPSAKEARMPRNVDGLPVGIEVLSQFGASRPVSGGDQG